MRKTRGQNYAPSKSAPSNAAETSRARNKFRMLNAHSGRLQRALSKPPICAAGRRIKSSCPPFCAHLSHCIPVPTARTARLRAHAYTHNARANIAAPHTACHASALADALPAHSPRVPRTPRLPNAHPSSPRAPSHARELCTHTSIYTLRAPALVVRTARTILLREPPNSARFRNRKKYRKN